ncbi:DMT family transporter [Xanthobacter sp. TB0139]|uniref:DMT family transporter n=1 Tax=Xanthobacter sp. TB0139 TaxID=3459178 RepID=UPI00403A3EDC
MPRLTNLLLTAMAPIIWGSSYIVTTQFLPEGYPLTITVLRALPAGLLLLLLSRQLPSGIWWLRAFLLGGLNFSLFWALLFISAYRLPGGVAATLGNFQPPIVILLAYLLLGAPIRPLSVLAVFAGISGVAMLVLTPVTQLDPLGIAAALGSAASMATGIVLTRRWQPPASSLSYTAWQLSAGGLLLIPLAIAFEPHRPEFTWVNIAAISWLSLAGAALSCLLWFRGLARLEAPVVSSLGFLSPLTAVLLGWVFLGQSLTAWQLLGAGLVLGSIWLNQRTYSAPSHSSPA